MTFRRSSHTHFRRVALLLAVSAAALAAQSPSAIVRRAEARRRAAREAVAMAAAAEAQLRVRPGRRGTVAVLAGSVTGTDIKGLAGGLSDLLAADLARVHALRVVERMRADAVVAERTLAGVDEHTRPRAWRLLGAADIVVVDADQRGGSLRLTARVVNLERARVDAVVNQTGMLNDLFAAQRRLSMDVLRALGVEPTAAERRSIIDRPSGSIDAFIAWTAAMDALESGDAPQAERLLRRALDADPAVNAAFDASVLAASGVAGALGAVVPMPGSAVAAGEDPTDEGLATEGNESEYGEAWFEGTGDKRLNVYELAVPLSVSMPLGRGRLDLSTLWSSNRVDTPANDVFHAWGFTDVHARFTQPLGATGLSLTVGGALPTRDAHGADDDIRRVPLPPDLLPTAIYRRRNAPSVAGGLYFVSTAGAWDWGAAAGSEWTASYDEVAPSLHTIAVAPGVRWRVRTDWSRALPVGHLSLGASLMALSPAKRAGASLTGGSRSLVRGSYSRPLGNADIEVGAWVLRSNPVSAAGTQVRAGSSVSAAFASVRRVVGPASVDAGVELKQWRTLGAAASSLWVPQLRVTQPLARGVQVEAGVDYVTGQFRDPPAATLIPVRGWLLRTGFRYEP